MKMEKDSWVCLLPLWGGVMIDYQNEAGFRTGSIQGLSYSPLGWGNEGP